MARGRLGMRSNEVFGLERSHATRARGSDGLAPLGVLHIPAREDALDARGGRTGLRCNVSLVVQRELAAQETGRGLVTDGKEEAVGWNVNSRVVLNILQANCAQQLITESSHRDVWHHELDLGVVARTCQHDLARTKLRPPVNKNYFRCIAREKRGLLHGRVAAADDKERLVAEDGGGAIAYRARGDALVPVATRTLSGPWEVHALRICAGRDNEGVGSHVVVLSEDVERPLREVHLRDHLPQNLCAETLTLLAEAVAQLAAHNTLREAREVLHLRGSCELPADHSVALKQNGLEFRACRIDGSRMRSRTAADDADLGAERLLRSRREHSCRKTRRHLVP
eukprot:m.29632 g.29632  ORF g.29632 m.29632 type:complete len:340 (+) comp4684_c0_seq1:118-1137(+)